jgi:hypothetical protein
LLGGRKTIENPFLWRRTIQQHSEGVFFVFFVFFLLIVYKQTNQKRLGHALLELNMETKQQSLLTEALSAFEAGLQLPSAV